MREIHDAMVEALGDRPALIAAACAAYETGAAAWPQVRVRPEALAVRIKARADAAGEDDVDDLHDADLYLTTALASGDPAAVAAFEARFIPDIDAALARLRLSAAACDEARQAVRIDLLVSEPGGVPRIESYLGIGPLAAWLRVTATRRALKLLRGTTRQETLDEIVVDGWPDASPDPGRRHFHREYASHLKSAVAEALASLTVRERNLIKQSVLDALSIDDLAAMYRVHRSNCARWLVDARAALARATRRALADRLGPRDGELDSVLRFVESDLELSLSRLLRQPTADHGSTG